MPDVFKLINATKETACRTAEAEAIRAKTGGTSPLAYDFNNDKGFADAISALPSGGSLPSSISKIDGGSFTLASDTILASYSIKHNLGVIPKGCFVWTEENRSADAYASNTVINYYYASNPFNTGSTDSVANWLCYWRRSTGATATVGGTLTSAQASNFVSSTEINPNRSENYKAGCTYKWLAWA